MVVPITKNGPKAILLFNLLFFTIINSNPITAPITKAKYKASNPALIPSKKPRLKTSLTSPKPIPLPFVTAQRIKIGNITIKPATNKSKILNPKFQINPKFKILNNKEKINNAI